jgi:predicted PhzF superfamily epimerase YddE/YHI9
MAFGISPTGGVPFCGHATAATAVALAIVARRDFVFETPVPGHQHHANRRRHDRVLHQRRTSG